MRMSLPTLLVAVTMAIGATATAQISGGIAPYEEGVERREAGVFFCDKSAIAAELAEMLNKDMLTQRQKVNGETLHVFGKDHPVMRLMSSRIANGECEVIHHEASFTPTALSYDGHFKDGDETIFGMNVIEASLKHEEEPQTIFILTDVPFLPKRAS